jgi:hypothetical protein
MGAEKETAWGRRMEGGRGRELERLREVVLGECWEIK